MLPLSWPYLFPLELGTIYLLHGQQNKSISLSRPFKRYHTVYSALFRALFLVAEIL